MGGFEVCLWQAGQRWKQESGASGGELNHLTEVLIRGAMRGKVQAGQLEESAYLLEAGQRMESWKRGKEMHIRKAILDGKKNGEKKRKRGKGWNCSSSGFNPYTR